MDHFHQMQVFQAVAEEQGFAAAARRLQISPPAVTRAIAALEDQLGVKLLNRTTRYVRATEAGTRYLEDARRILLEVEAAAEAAAGIGGGPTATVVDAGYRDPGLTCIGRRRCRHFLAGGQQQRGEHALATGQRGIPQVARLTIFQVEQNMILDPIGQVGGKVYFGHAVISLCHLPKLTPDK